MPVDEHTRQVEAINAWVAIQKTMNGHTHELRQAQSLIMTTMELVPKLITAKQPIGDIVSRVEIADRKLENAVKELRDALGCDKAFLADIMLSGIQPELDAVKKRVGLQ